FSLTPVLGRLEDKTQTRLRAAGIGAIRKALALETFAEPGRGREHSVHRAVCLIANSGVILRVEYVECFEIQKQLEPFGERKRLGQPRIDTIGPIYVKAVERQERNTIR